MHRSMVVSIIAIVALVACGPQPAPVIDLSGPAQGTMYSIKVAAPPADIDAHAVRLIVDDVLQRIDLQMSGYRPDSEISRFNESRSTDWVAVSSDVASVVVLAKKVSEASEGALDVTVAPLVNLWGMGPAGELKSVPAEADIAQAQARVGFRQLEVRMDPPALRKAHPDLAVDLNAVAQGYTVDVIAQRFAAAGLTNFMIDLGGEVRVQGRNAMGELWRIAIERPVNTDPQPYAIAKLDNCAITTSGEYRHFIDRDGHRYSHTIDPRTGRPVQHSLASVAVVATTAAEADAWSTALNVLGENEGYALANQRGMAALFIIDRNGVLESRTTPAMRKYVETSESR